jgi:hypothetical protein
VLELGLRRRQLDGELAEDLGMGVKRVAGRAPRRVGESRPAGAFRHPPKGDGAMRVTSHRVMGVSPAYPREQLRHEPRAIRAWD